MICVLCECNTDKPSTLEHVKAGLAAWTGLADKAIIATVPGLSHIYDEILPICEECQIMLYGGLKTASLLRRQFCAATAWREVANEANRISDATSDWVWLDHETAWHDVLEGTEPYNAADLKAGLRYLLAVDPNISYIWYPGPVGDNEDSNEWRRSHGIVKTVQGVLGDRVQFIDKSMDRPRKLVNPVEARNRDWLIRAAKNETVPILYCYGNTFWPDEWCIEIAELLSEPGDVLLSPGYMHFVDAGDALSRLWRTQ